MSRISRRWDGQVTPNDVVSYCQEEGIESKVIDDDTFAFSASDPSAADLGSTTVSAVHQGRGKWSVAAALYRAPEEDTEGSSALFRKTMRAQGRLGGSGGIFEEGGVVGVGNYISPDTPRDLIGDVAAIGSAALHIQAEAFSAAEENGVTLKPLYGDDQ